jgi:phenylacetate-coenzyme A ligase PaaK-like adenylate-forming protein/acyl-CoA reductase-like NAD-dependent aldehyde dehydrogenase
MRGGDSMLERHLWQGEFVDDAELEKRLSSFSVWAASAANESLDPRVLLDAAQAYAGRLRAKAGNYSELRECLLAAGVGTESEVEALLAESAEFLDRNNLEAKLRRELGSTSPFLPARTGYSDSIFEAWAPLGLLVHVAPSNAPTAAPLSVIEGLLAGNVNFLKTSGSESWFPQLFLDGLGRCDATGTLARFIVAARISSKKKDLLERIFAAADGIAAWGGEEAMREIRKLAPSSTRVVEWGHKISFVYLAAGEFGKADVLEDVAREVCAFEQQACSSPQVLYLETSDWNEVEKFLERFAPVLDRVSRATPRLAQSAPESAEITLVTELARQEASFGRAKVVEGSDKGWRILADARPALAASPLFRTIWLKPLPRRNIIATLRPMRAYLQTAGLACGLKGAAELSGLLLKAGAVRVRRVGDMMGSYSGEAHDGVYALQRYCRRVSVQLGPEAEGISSFADLRRDAPPSHAHKPKIMTKADFQAMKVDEKHAQLYFKSGGSSGEPKLSVFTYDDYHEQMLAGADGLYAAGLDPLKDRSMNLFFSGSLYGGFLSIFSVLEELKAVHFPMAAQTDLAMVADSIIKNKVNVLLGMPSYLVSLFEQQRDVLRRGSIDKIFYGGEHFNEAQRRYLSESFGIDSIKSIGYGSVDAGPLGYQCRSCDGGAHHLHQRLQFLEILEIDKDAPVQGEEIGRLVFTSRVRQGQTLERYDLGDVGHWIASPCACGRASPRFRLLGRSGDVFRIGTSFFNYQKFATILAERLGHAGAVQVVLDHDGLKEKITVRLSADSGTDSAKARATLLESDHDLAEVVDGDKVLLLDVVGVAPDVLEKTKGSGKLVRILDRRTR